MHAGVVWAALHARCESVPDVKHNVTNGRCALGIYERLLTHRTAPAFYGRHTRAKGGALQHRRVQWVWYRRYPHAHPFGRCCWGSEKYEGLLDPQLREKGTALVRPQVHE
eukprot:366408-Chlamydomonas_euryale.AAC.1